MIDNDRITIHCSMITSITSGSISQSTMTRELMSYNDIITHLERDQEERFFGKFKGIIGHQGPPSATGFSTTHATGT